MYRMIRSDIYVNDEGEIDVDYMSQSHGGLSTKVGRSKSKTGSQFDAAPYITSDKLLNGHTVYSVYPYGGDDQVELFKRIKKGDMDKNLYDEWLDYTARYISQAIIRTNRPDILVIPESSSSLVLDLARKVSKYARIDYLPHAFIKNPVDKITLSISKGDPGYDSTMKVLDKIRKNGSFEAKLVPKRMLKFFRDIYTNDDKYENMLEGKKVAVIDDSMTSKATMMNIFDVCDYLYGTSDAYGITIFKHSNSQGAN